MANPCPSGRKRAFNMPRSKNNNWGKDFTEYLLCHSDGMWCVMYVICEKGGVKGCTYVRAESNTQLTATLFK